MTIKKIKVSNFKSFKNLEVELNDFNIFIGGNAAGKSGFVQVFNFLKIISRDGLRNAVSMQGGVEYLRNINIGGNEPLSFEIVFNGSGAKKLEKEERDRKLYRQPLESSYSFSIDFSQNDNDHFEILEDRLTRRFLYKECRDGQEKEIGKVSVTLFNNKGKPDIEIDDSGLQGVDGFEFKKEEIIPPFFGEVDSLGEELLLETAYALLLDSSLRDIVKGISIYNINPGLPKRAAPSSGKAELEEDGSNLALILKRILENEEKKRKFSNLIQDVLPFVEKMGVEKISDSSLLLKLKEIYVKDKYIPASLLSDGTIIITALIIALYFDRKKILIIEEPERNIHPHLISKLVEMFADASRKKQLLITTHNPEIVKYVDLKKLFLVQRDKEGFSKISRPFEKEEVRVFLENEMGIDELYIQNLLEV